MTVTQTHSAKTQQDAEAYLRDCGFRPIKATVWVRGDFKATAVLTYEDEALIRVMIRERQG